MSKKVKLCSYHWHEALDRTHVILSNIDDFLLDHPAISQNKNLKKQVEKASKILFQVYQDIGAVDYEKLNK